MIVNRFITLIKISWNVGLPKNATAVARTASLLRRNVCLYPRYHLVLSLTPANKGPKLRFTQGIWRVSFSTMMIPTMAIGSTIHSRNRAT